MTDQEIRKACISLINLIKQGATIYYDSEKQEIHRICKHSIWPCWNDPVLGCKWREYCWVRNYRIDPENRLKVDAKKREGKYLNHPAIMRMLLYMGLL